MIIFDYGHTLVYEDIWDGVKAEKALLNYAVKNKNNLTAEQIAEFNYNLFGELRRLNMNNLEFSEQQFSKLVYEYLQIEIDLNPVKMEEIYWDNAAPGHAMPYIKEVLEYLHKNNIRTGVISNIAFSGEALKNRIDKVLPENHFEFIMASSEYIVRKQHKILFEIALRKADIEPNEAWYCGDSPDFDVKGANSAGIFPVWYESEIECWYRERGSQNTPECDHLHLKNWRELIEVLECIK